MKKTLTINFSIYMNKGNQQQQQQPRRPPPRRTFERNILKRNPDYGRHWGDLRAAFELSVDSILEFYREKNLNDSDYTSDNDDAFHSERKANSAQRRHRPHRYAYEQMNMLVRKDLAASLRNLIQHGLIGCYQSDASDVYRPTGLSLCPSSHGGGSGNQALASSSGPVSSLLSMGLGCFSSQNGSALIKKSPSHAWELILYYYDLKVGTLLVSWFLFLISISLRTETSFAPRPPDACRSRLGSRCCRCTADCPKPRRRRA